MITSLTEQKHSLSWIGIKHLDLCKTVLSQALGYKSAGELLLKVLEEDVV